MATPFQLKEMDLVEVFGLDNEEQSREGFEIDAAEEFEDPVLQKIAVDVAMHFWTKLAKELRGNKYPLFYAQLAYTRKMVLAKMKFERAINHGFRMTWLTLTSSIVLEATEPDLSKLFEPGTPITAKKEDEEGDNKVELVKSEQDTQMVDAPLQQAKEEKPLKRRPRPTPVGME